MQVELIAVTRYLKADGSPEALIERAGRVCYRSASRGDPAAFLRARLQEGHESIIEHAAATFEVSGISRACSHQLVRHRIASYSQESQRYIDMAAPEWVLPEAITEVPEARRTFEALLEEVQGAYQALREQGLRKEDARFVLPNATATRIIVTMNFRELRHFFKIRIAPEAQWEIRQMAILMLEAIAAHAPTIFGELLEGLQEHYPHFWEG